MRAYLFVLIYAGMLPLALLSPFAGAMIWAWLSLMYPQSQTYGYFSFGFAAPVAALTLAAFLLSRERALPPSTAVAWSMAGMILACGVAHATAIDREIGAVRWDTICVHGDNPAAVAMASEVRTTFERAGVDVRPLIAVA